MGLNFINFPSYGNYSHSIASSLYKGSNEKAPSITKHKNIKPRSFENNKSLRLHRSNLQHGTATYRCNDTRCCI